VYEQYSHTHFTADSQNEQYSKATE